MVSTLGKEGARRGKGDRESKLKGRNKKQIKNRKDLALILRLSKVAPYLAKLYGRDAGGSWQEIKINSQIKANQMKIHNGK